MVKSFLTALSVLFCQESIALDVEEIFKKCLKYSKYFHNHVSGCFVSLKIEVWLNFAFHN